MDSRLAKALRKLGEKCTVTGTEIQGDNVDGIVECIADHFSGDGSGSCLIKPIVADRDNITSFRELETGLYTFHGFFTPYFGSDISMSAPYPVLGSVINDGDISYVQILFPYKNQVQYLEITDDSYTEQKIKLAQYGVINVAEFQQVMEYATQLTLDHECETMSEVITSLAEKIASA